MTCTKVDKRVLMGFYAFCLLTPLFIFCSADGQEAKKKEKYVFSADFFSSRIPVWEEVLRPWKGKGDIRYLEIGVFEGRSFLWMLDNILTHPTARATAIDIFPRDSKTVFLNNLRISGAENRVETRVGRSEAELRRFEPGSFDLIYIDGSHLAADVLIDAVLSWPLLKNNGLMIFDDYSLQVESAPMELRPQVAIDALITAHRNDLEIVHSSWQLILRKKEGQAFALRLGQYEYEWSQANLYTAGMKDLIPLSDKEKELIGKLFMGREFGEVSFCPTPEMLHDPDFIRLKERLKLDLKAKSKTPSIRSYFYSPPSIATLVSPSEAISNKTPTYTWNAVGNATYYRLRVSNSLGKVFDRWYKASEVTSGSACSLTPAIALTDGTYSWRIQTWSPYGFGRWSARMSFTIRIGLPDPRRPNLLLSFRYR